MRISDWSLDVCSSDLVASSCDHRRRVRTGEWSSSHHYPPGHGVRILKKTRHDRYSACPVDRPDPHHAPADGRCARTVRAPRYMGRSDERGVGTEVVNTRKRRGRPDYYKKKQKTNS